MIKLYQESRRIKRFSTIWLSIGLQIHKSRGQWRNPTLFSSDTLIRSGGQRGLDLIFHSYINISFKNFYQFPQFNLIQEGKNRSFKKIFYSSFKIN